MTILTPIFANEATAAKLLDMPLAEFRAHVQSANLPRGKEIVPGALRWSVEDLRKIARGDAIDGGIEW